MNDIQGNRHIFFRGTEKNTVHDLTAFHCGRELQPVLNDSIPDTVWAAKKLCMTKYANYKSKIVESLL
jgi:hypothetical protein